MKGNVLLVRWNEADAIVEAQNLRLNGWIVEYEAENSGNAEKKVKKNPPDFILIFLDHNPKQGFELAESLLKSKEADDFSIILVDGNDDAIKKAYEKFPDLSFTTTERLNDVLHSKFHSDLAD